MKPDDILIALRDLTGQERIEFLPLAPEMRKPSAWQHLTGTFTFGGGESKAELDEIIRQSIALWKD